MRLLHATADQYIYFVAVDATDLKTRETGLSGFAVSRSRNGGTPAAYSTPTVTEVSSSLMPGVYKLLVDEDVSMATLNATEEMVLHITHSLIAPVTRVIELFKSEWDRRRDAHNTSETFGAQVDAAVVSMDAGVITNFAFADNAIDAAVLATNTITAAKIAANAIGSSEIANNAITADKIADNAIASEHLATGAITADTMATGSIDAAALSNAANVEIATSVWKLATDTSTATQSGSFGEALTDLDPPTKAEMDTAHALLATVAKQNIIGTNIDQIETAVIANATGTDIAADIIALKAETVTILADTDELQSDDVPTLIASLNNITADAVKVQADAALVDIHLDHLMKSSAADTDITNQSVIAQMVATSGNWSGFDKTTDSLQAASENASLIRTTIATRASQTSFTLTAGSPDNDAYNGALAIFTDYTTFAQTGFARISDYVGSSKTVTLAAAPGYAIAAADKIEIRLVGADKIESEAAADAAFATYGPNTTTPPTASNIYSHFTTSSRQDTFKASVSGLSTLSTGDVLTQAAAALVAINLDHLMFEAVDDENDMTTEVANETVLCNILSKTQDTSSYDHGLHSLEAGPARALKDINLDHLMAVTALDTDIINGSVIAQIVASGTPANWSGFVNTTDSLQAIGENLENGTDGLSALKTLIDEVKTETTLIVADTAEIGTAGAGLTEAGATGNHLTAIPWNSAWDAEVQSECTDALNAYDPPTKAEMDTAHGLLATVAKQDVIDTNIDQIETAVITNAAGADVAADIIALKTETALIVADTDELQVDNVPGLISGLNNISTTQVNTEVDTALADINLDHLMKLAAADTDVTNNSAIAQMAASGATATWSTFVNTTDSLQAIRDRGDGSWTTGAGGSSPTEAEIYTYFTASSRQNTFKADVSALSTVTTTQVGAEVDASLADIHLDHLLSLEYTGQGHAESLLRDLTESDGGTYRFTSNALEEAPSGTGASASTIATAVWDRDTDGHTTSGTFGEQVKTDIDGILAVIGAAGAGLTEAGATGNHLSAIPWNAAWDAEVQSEVADALIAINLNHLMKEAALDADITTNSVIGQLAATNGNFANFNKDEDSLQSIKDNAAWNTGNTTTPPTVAAIRSEMETSAGMLFSVDAIADKLDTALEADGGGGDWQFTSSGLENAPSGTGASAATIADAVWNEAMGDHKGPTTFGGIQRSLHLYSSTVYAAVADTEDLQYDLIDGDHATNADAYNECLAVFTDQSNTDIVNVARITDYAAGNRRITIDVAPTNVPVAGDYLTIVPAIALRKIENNVITAASLNADAVVEIVGGMNDISTDEVNAAVDTALSDIYLDQLIATSYDSADPDGSGASLLNELTSNDGGSTRFTTNALSLAPTGGSAPTVGAIRAEMDSNSTQLAAIVADTDALQTDLTDGGRLDLLIDLILADTNELQSDDVPGLIGALNDISTTQVNAQVDAALADIHLDKLLAANYDPASKPGVATALLNEVVENDGGVSRFTANSLELAPTGSGGGATAAAVADAVWGEAMGDHQSPTSFGGGLQRGALLWSGAIETVTDETHYIIEDGTHSTGADSYVDCIAVFTDQSDRDIVDVRRIVQYNPVNQTITVDSEPDNDILAGDYLTIIPALPLNKIGNNAITSASLASSAVEEIIDAFIAHRGTAAGGASGSITLASTASATANLYRGGIITLVGGTGAGQSRRITGYSVAKVADVEPDWTTNPETDNTKYVITGDGRPRLRSVDQLTLDGIAVTLGTAGDGLTDLGGMSTEMKASILVEALKVLQATSMPEPSAGVPAATPNLDDAIMYLYGALRNKLTVTEDFKTLHNSSDVALYKKPLADDGDTFTESESTTV